VRRKAKGHVIEEAPPPERTQWSRPRQP
jgi:hypothetical protein